MSDGKRCPECPMRHCDDCPIDNRSVEEEDDGTEIEFEADDLVAALKGIIYEMGVPIAVWCKAPLLKHINLHARGSKEIGHWLFYISEKDEKQEKSDGPVGHA